jgi:hypothetical protein
MAFRRKKRRNFSKKSVKKKREPGYLLEKTSPYLINLNKSIHEQKRKYEWDFYSELAYQRERIHKELGEVLNQACLLNFSFENYQRAMRLEYIKNPLSSLGSIKTIPGGRFNICEGLNSNIPSFSALYIASDKETAIREVFGQPFSSTEKGNPPLTSLDFALTRHESMASIRMHGFLEKVIDLEEAQRLEPFINLVKHFSFSESLLKEGQKLGSPPKIIQTIEELLPRLFENDWRGRPMLYDVPATSQIFGQLVYQAKIEGILYPSKFNGKKCLVIFPENLQYSAKSFIEVTDKLPTSHIPKRLDFESWKVSLKDRE